MHAKIKASFQIHLCKMCEASLSECWIQAIKSFSVKHIDSLPTCLKCDADLDYQYSWNFKKLSEGVPGELLLGAEEWYCEECAPKIFHSCDECLVTVKENFPFTRFFHIYHLKASDCDTKENLSQ